MNNFHDVDSFHEKFGLPRGDVIRLMDPEIYQFRINFLWEEIQEIEEARMSANLVGVIDGLCDFVYVACGTALFMGCPRIGHIGSWPSFREVRESAKSFGLLPPEVGTMPRLLPNHLHAFGKTVLKLRLEAFELAYSAAIERESGALTLALHSLKMCTNSAFTMAALMNAPWENCWRHVHEVNMMKQRAASDGSDSKRKSSFDVVKPAGWKAPESKIAMELQLAGWRVPDFLEVDNATGKVRVMNAIQ